MFKTYLSKNVLSGTVTHTIALQAAQFAAEVGNLMKRKGTGGSPPHAHLPGKLTIPVISRYH